MRNLACSVALLALALVACGPSSKEVATAKSARYQGDKLALFAEVKAVVESKYKLEKSDETTLGMQTKGRWYSPDGVVAAQHSAGTGAHTGREHGLYPDKSILILLVVTMLPEGDKWVVKVTPIMERYHAGSPKTEPLKENNADVPGWATSKVDELALDIHKALAKYEVKSVPGSVPPATPSAPAPDEPTGSAAAPAEGSAAGAATP